MHGVGIMQAKKQTIIGAPLDGRTVIVRADYNVPLASDGSIRDDTRIRASLPTLRALLDRGCRVVIVSHLGRPGGKRVPALSLAPVANRLARLMGQRITFLPEAIGSQVRDTIQKSAPTSLILLENLRFYPGEETNDMAFARALQQSTGAEYLVQDGFGIVHRAQASTEALGHVIPAVAGLLVEKEITALAPAIDHPARPLTVVLGGAKAADKMPLLARSIQQADHVLIGGVIATAILQRLGAKVGKSQVDAQAAGLVDAIIAQAQQRARQLGRSLDDFLVLPRDVGVGRSKDSHERHDIDINQVQPSDVILDIGAASANRFAGYITSAKTVVWNGTLGYAENETFARGSVRVAMAMANTPGIVSIIGGGDTANFVHHIGLSEDSFTHVSTGGGASLAFISGESLPGIRILLDDHSRV